jgi:Family of unknown function (DUF5947)
MASPTVAGSRLRQLAQRSSEQRAAAQEAALEVCDLCGEPIPAEHRHLLDLSSRELKCACQACRLLFDRPAAGGDHYRLIPDRRLALVDFELDEPTWAGLAIPVEMAFFFRNTQAERVSAFYPSPAGPTESLLGLEAWTEIEEANPVLGTMEPDVEALLVNRARGARQHFLVPLEDCYRLVALIRTHWRGLSGGKQVWTELEAFFEALEGRSKVLEIDGKEPRWRTSESASRT